MSLAEHVAQTLRQLMKKMMIYEQYQTLLKEVFAVYRHKPFVSSSEITPTTLCRQVQVLRVYSIHVIC